MRGLAGIVGPISGNSLLPQLFAENCEGEWNDTVGESEIVSLRSFRSQTGELRPGSLEFSEGELVEQAARLEKHTGRLVEHPGRLVEQAGGLVEHPGRFVERPGRFVEHAGRLVEQACFESVAGKLHHQIDQTNSGVA